MSKDAKELRGLAEDQPVATGVWLRTIADKLEKLEDDAALLDMQRKFKIDVRESTSGWHTFNGYPDVGGKRSPREVLKAWRRANAGWLPASMLRGGA